MHPISGKLHQKSMLIPSKSGCPPPHHVKSMPFPAEYLGQHSCFVGCSPTMMKKTKSKRHQKKRKTKDTKKTKNKRHKDKVKLLAAENLEQHFFPALCEAFLSGSHYMNFEFKYKAN